MVEGSGFHLQDDEFLPPPGGCCVSSAELPEVEKLHLSESMESSGEEQELVEEEELRRFRELKDKMILLDEAELGSATPAKDTSLFR